MFGYDTASRACTGAKSVSRSQISTCFNNSSPGFFYWKVKHRILLVTFVLTFACTDDYNTKFLELHHYTLLCGIFYTNGIVQERSMFLKCLHFYLSCLTFNTCLQVNMLQQHPHVNSEKGHDGVL